ncbi:lymphotoxin-alpha [Haplochromis burtoni]|uniref:lymphotoxin-alpha n=1 Tax=Haplochromis burtoni TaxID=8153 RepID=UPI0003BD3D31|nr:lymphotoxin-alpha [Haplochromis burtoni]
MEEDKWGFEVGEEAVLQSPNTSLQLLSPNETRNRRMAKVLALVLVLVLAGVLPLLITILLGSQRHAPPGSQPTTPPDLSVNKLETSRHQNLVNPAAMLTAPVGNNTNGQYLQWAHDIGNAYCHGGFSYSNGDLVVPRDGLYSVYLQITYSGLVCPVHKKLMNKVLHSSEEYRNDMTLLSSIHTMSCSEDVWSKSLYTAGFFFLKAKDKLRVMSSHPDYITKAEYEVFFGAVLFPH